MDEWYILGFFLLKFKYFIGCFSCQRDLQIHTAEIIKKNLQVTNILR